MQTEMSSDRKRIVHHQCNHYMVTLVVIITYSDDHHNRLSVCMHFSTNADTSSTNYEGLQTCICKHKLKIWDKNRV